MMQNMFVAKNVQSTPPRLGAVKPSRVSHAEDVRYSSDESSELESELESDVDERSPSPTPQHHCESGAPARKWQ
jgi:hypothetical protein